MVLHCTQAAPHRRLTGSADAGDLRAMTKPMLHNVQLLRFVAAGTVLVSHTADLLIPHDNPIWRVDWVVGVDIFFVISGFIMVYLTRGCFGVPGVSRDFLIRRVIRVVPPYWLFTTLMIAAALLFGSDVHNATLTPAQIVTSYGFVPWPRGDGKLNPILSLGWTLNYEMLFYAAFTLALLAKRGLPLLAGAFVLMVIAGVWLPGQQFVLRFWCAPIILEFVAGMGLAVLYLRGVRLPMWQALLSLGLGVLLLLAMPALTGPATRAIRLGIPAFFICAGPMLMADRGEPGRLGRALRLCGDASYALYLSHPFTINAFVLLARRAGLDAPWPVLFAAMAGAIVAAIAIHRLVERPITDALQRWAGTKPLRGAAEVAP
jgi:exopolysaccharide production protein ExoZ